MNTGDPRVPGSSVGASTGAGAVEPAPQRFGKFLLFERIAAEGRRETRRSRAALRGFAVRLTRLEISPTELSYFFPVFVEEMSRAGFLFHRAVHQVLEFGQIDGVPFFTADDPEASDLSSVLAECRRQRVPFPIPCAIYVAREIAAALAYAHGRRWASGESLGVLHGALLPQEILLSSIGEVRVSGFGTFRALNRVALLRGFIDDSSTEFLAPETVSRSVPDPRSDVYGCAALLYAMLTNRTPRESALVGKASPPSSLRGKVSPELDALCALALADVPADRPFDAPVLEDELTRLLQAEAPYFGPRDLSAFLNGLRDGTVARSVDAKRKARIAADPRREHSTGSADLDVEVSTVRHAPWAQSGAFVPIAASEDGPTTVVSAPALVATGGVAVPPLSPAPPPPVVDRPIVAVGPRFGSSRGLRAPIPQPQHTDRAGWKVVVGLLLGLALVGVGGYVVWYLADASTDAPAVVPVRVGGALGVSRTDGGGPVRKIALEPWHVVESAPAPQAAPAASPAQQEHPTQLQARGGGSAPSPASGQPKVTSRAIRPRVFATGTGSSARSDGPAAAVPERPAPSPSAPAAAEPGDAAKAAPAEVPSPPDAPSPSNAPVPDTGPAGEPSGSSTSPGSLTLTSDLYASVTIDGTAAGTTPLRKKELEPGRHTIVLFNPDNRLSKTIELEIASGKAKSHHVRWDD